MAEIDQMAGTTVREAGSDVVGLVRRLGAAVAELVGSLDERTRHAPTPCSDMDAHALVEHLVTGLELFAAAADGASLAHAEHALPAAEETPGFGDALAHAVAAWSVPGRLDSSYAMPWGPTAGRMLVSFLVVELAGHGWDLATALGRPLAADDADVEAADAVARRTITSEVRVPGMFGPEVVADPDAPALDRLAAFLGRRP